MIPVTTFSGRPVAVFGLGLSGLASARALVLGEADIAVWDDSEAGRRKALEAGLPVVDLREADFSEFAALVLAPGVPLTHPEPHWVVKKAQASGVEIIGDTELFFRERAATGSAAKVIAITGTNGKSTTTAMITHLLKSAGVKAEMGGNIGKAVLELAPLSDNQTYVIEFSSYQIDLTPTLTPDAAALLNITPDHLDRHGTLENYARIKAKVFDQLGAGGCAVISVDDDYCRAVADRLEGPFEIVQISCDRHVQNGVYAQDGVLHPVQDGKSQSTVSLSGITSLRGAHNWQNAAAAYALVKCCGVNPDVIAEGLKSFPGLAHRMEVVGHLGPILFVNDSKATNADAGAKALSAFEEIYWIAGGRAKEGGISGLRAYYPRIAKAYLIGEAADDIASALEGEVVYEISGTLDAAVASAAADASRSSGFEPVVLLSPACASFDQFPNFAIRGDAFRNSVAALSGVTMHGREAA